jgi:hypothetical protein
VEDSAAQEVNKMLKVILYIIYIAISIACVLDKERKGYFDKPGYHEGYTFAWTLAIIGLLVVEFINRI